MKLNIYGHMPIIAPRDPVDPMEVTTKNYVDTNLSLHADDTGLHFTAAEKTWIEAIVVSATEINHLAGVTSAVQTQIDDRLRLSGGVLTGHLTLAGNPTENLHAAPKSYVDSSSAQRVAKSGDTMTGLLTLSGNPTENLHAAPKQYVDSKVTDHANDFTLHITPEQNNWIDNITVTSTEVNALADIGGSVKDQLNTKFDKAGGNISGDVTLAEGKTVFVGKTPVQDNELVNKAYVDSKLKGQEWKDPVSNVNLVSLNTNTLPETPAEGETHIVGNSPTGELVGKAGWVVSYVGGVWVDIKAGPLAVDDRFGISFDDHLSVSGELSDHVGKIITITTATPGAVEYIFDVITPGSTTLVFDPDSQYFGVTFTYTDEGVWVPTNTSVNLSAGDGLELDGKLLNVKVGDGVQLVNDRVSVKFDPISGIKVSQENGVAVKLNGNTLSVDIDGLRIAESVMNTLGDKLSKSAGGTITGGVIFGSNASLEIGYTPIEPAQAVNKHYVDAADANLQGQVTTLQGKVATLEIDPVTKGYVDTQLALKLNKSGGVLSGHLTLHADPTSGLHAATKQYVDTGLTSHVENQDLHMTPAQNTWMDAITVSSTEVNHLSGVTTNVQEQITERLKLSGGTMTGQLLLAAAPTQDEEAANKAYVDNSSAQRVAKSGGTMTGLLTLSGDPTANLHATPKQYVDSSLSSVNTSLQANIDQKVAKSGDTMTGLLTLSGTPIDALHAATKSYVDVSYTSMKSYVDSADEGIQDSIDTLNSKVTALETDPVTRQFVEDGLSTKLDLAGGTMTGYITLHADPQQAMHPVTKQYVDAVAQGLHAKPAVRLATTTNLAASYNNGTQGVNSTLTGSSNGTLVVDGVTPLVGDRILVRAQTSKLQNGDYSVQQVGDASTPFILRRTTTVDESHEVPGSYFYVFDGATLKGTGWVFVVENPVSFTMGVSDIPVHQFSGQGTVIAGAGLELDGNTINVQTANASRIVVNQDNIDLATTGVAPGSYTKVTVDGYGRVLAASSPTTLAGYNISDGQPLNANLTSLSGVTTTGIIVRSNTNQLVTRAITHSGVGLSVTNGDGAVTGDIVINSNATHEATPSTLVSRDASGNFAANIITAALSGNASTATALQNSRQFSITGDVAAAATSFNGTNDVVLSTTLSNTGVAAGTYNEVVVDAKGRVTSAVKHTSITAAGYLDAATKEELVDYIKLLEQKVDALHMFVMGRI